MEAIESRVLLSAYTLGTLGDFGINTGGANPQSTLVADAGGNLYGTASAGGPYGRGTVFEVASGSNPITTLASFNGTNGATPSGALAIDASGNLYGATSAGAYQNAGTIFEVAKGSNAITTLAALGGAYGSNPVGGVTLNASGDLFGMTKAGGASYYGVLFEIPHGSKSATVLVSFNGQNGSSPDDALTLDAFGNLWGTTYGGGVNNRGTVFEMAEGSSAITNVTSFATTGNGGIYPEGGVTLDASGDIFGTTHGGGSFGVGTVFEIPHASAMVTTLAMLSNQDELSPQGPESALVLDSSGNLYGTTDRGGTSSNGTVFELAVGSNTVTTLASFNNGRDPFVTPTQATLTKDGSDNLYVITNLGGANSNGTILEIAAGSLLVTPVASFNATNGNEVRGTLTPDRAGNLFGTTYLGGAGDNGTVFEIAQGSNAITTVALFNGGNGYLPLEGLAEDASDNLYGGAYAGGGADVGTVFEIPAGLSSLTTVASFSQTSGSYPESGVTLDPSGNLYGTTVYGGAHDQGEVFEITKGSAAITLLASFQNSSGTNAESELTLDTLGNLYGVTFGDNSIATVFELVKGSGVITSLASFSRNPSAAPFAGVTLDAADNIYGTTPAGGSNGDGTLFELAKGSDTLTTLVSFAGPNGSHPYSGLTLDAMGNLYGTTTQGGSYNDGTVFELPRDSTTISTLISFNGDDGAFPEAGLTGDGRGNFYATTVGGGASGLGTAFELAANSAVTLTQINGQNPSSADQPLGFAATVSAGVPDGETLELVDTSNDNAVVASGTLSNGSATLSISPGTLLAGTHNLIAVYGGDANFGASESAPYTQTVQVAVTGVAVNGNNNSLAGVQRSMVDSIVYTFSEAVNLATTNAFGIAVDAGQSGTVPSLAWAAINPNSDGSSSQWVVTFSGAGVTGGSIGNGVYDITLNSSAATSDANPAVSAQSRPADTFYRLFGDINGDGRVNNADYAAFLSTNGLKTGQAGFNAAFDSNSDGRINNSDYALMLTDNRLRYSGFVMTI